MPIEVENLLSVAGIKILCRKLGIIKILQKSEKILFTFDKERFNIDVEKVIKKYANKIMFSSGITPYFTYKLENLDNVLDEIKRFLKELI